MGARKAVFDPARLAVVTRRLVSSDLSERQNTALGINVSDAPPTKANGMERTNAGRIADTLRWEPLLAEDTRPRAIEMIREIAADLLVYRPPRLSQRRSSWPSDPGAQASLATGAAGFALLFDYLAEADIFRGAGGLSAAYLDVALAAAEAAPLGPSLYSGVAGIAWVFAQTAGGGIDPDQRGLTAVVERLATAIKEDKAPCTDFDLINGVAGYGVLATEVVTRGGSPDLAEAVTQWLADRTHEATPGTWFTGAHLLARYPVAPWRRPCFDLGVAHGIPGVLAALADIEAAGVCGRTIAPLVQSGIEWTFAQRLPAGQGSAFPWMVGPEITTSPARAAWCYGDPGIAAVLYRVCAPGSERQHELAAIASGALARSAEQAHVVDETLCHGAAGLGHLANRLFHTTGLETFRESGRRWFDRVLAKRSSLPFGGLETYARAQNPRTDLGVLEGVTGIALALAAAASAAEPTWDRCLLLSGTGGSSSNRTLPVRDA